MTLSPALLELVEHCLDALAERVAARLRLPPASAPLPAAAPANAAARAAAAEPPAEYLTEREAEALIGLRRRSLEYRRHNKIGPPYVKIGAVVRYRRSVVLQWALSLERQ